MKNFESREAFLGAVEAAFAGVSPDVRKAIIDGIRQADIERNGSADNDETADENAGFELRLGKWFIRNDDLPIFEAMGAAAGAAAGPPGAGLALLAPIIGFAAAVWKVIRKGATLSKLQVRVLGALTKGTLTVEELVPRISTNTLAVTTDEVEEALGSLSHLVLHDGTEIAIVRRDAAGRWTALDI